MDAPHVAQGRVTRVVVHATEQYFPAPLATLLGLTENETPQRRQVH